MDFQFPNQAAAAPGLSIVRRDHLQGSAIIGQYFNSLLPFFQLSATDSALSIHRDRTWGSLLGHRLGFWDRQGSGRISAPLPLGLGTLHWARAAWGGPGVGPGPAGVQHCHRGLASGINTGIGPGGCAGPGPASNTPGAWAAASAITGAHRGLDHWASVRANLCHSCSGFNNRPGASWGRASAGWPGPARAGRASSPSSIRANCLLRQDLPPPANHGAAQHRATGH